MAGLSVKCVPCKRALTPEEVYENASLRTALGAIHDVKFGHRLMLVPDSAKKTGQDSLAGQVAGALGASQSIDVKWKQFQDRFQQILNQSVGAVATAFEHEELGVVVPKALPAEDVRTRAFGGDWHKKPRPWSPDTRAPLVGESRGTRTSGMVTDTHAPCRGFDFAKVR